MKPGVLYLSYDGMLEPLGQSQVLAYLRALAQDHRVHLISFEKPEDWHDASRRDATAASIAGAGIHWVPLRYHRRPSAPATAFDIAHGTLAAIWLIRRERLSLIHARSYVAATMALAAKRATGAAMLFDMRGFWADERVDGGLWPAGSALYRAAKGMERRLLLAADHVVTLTHASVAELRSFPYLADRSLPITVVPTCADLQHFQRPPGVRQPADFVVGHAGAVGTWYLFDELLLAFRLIGERRPNARLLIVNRGEHERIRAGIDAFGIDPARIELTSASFDQMPAMLSRMTVGSAIIKPAYSKIASAPTKLAEYLGCGIPCLGNDRVGDVARILETDRVGVAIDDFTPSGRERAIDRLLSLVEDPDLADRCAATARAQFSLARGVQAYREIYRTLLTGSDTDRQASLGHADLPRIE